MPNASSCLLHVLCFAETQYQTESKRGKNGRRIILEYLGFSRGRINAKRCPRWPRDRGTPSPRARLTPWGAPPASCPPRASSRVDSSSQKSHIFQKKSPSIFIPFGLRLIWIFCETKNMQQTGTGTGYWINMLVPKIV